MAKGEPELNIVETQQQADGRDTHIETSKVPLRNADGEVVGILGIFADITERKQLEEDLLAAKEAAEASDRAKGDFLAAMSHELRTPLTLILGPMESLMQDHQAELTPASKAALDRIYRNACRLKSLTDDILDYTKGQAGLSLLANEHVEVVAHTRELIDDMQAAADTRGLSLRFQANVEEIWADVDIRKFDKVLLNLVGNALKFTPKDGPIEVVLSSTEDDLTLVVVDTGIGIDRAHHDKLFNRFVQFDASSTRKYGGTGIGLALVKQFAELMGGNVQLESELGKGAKFIVTLPSTQEDAATSNNGGSHVDNAAAEARRRAQTFTTNASQKVIGGESAQTTATQNKPRVRVAEDNSDLRRYMIDLLSNDFDVRAASDGQLALQLARSFKPAAILSDVMMPNLDGFQLAQAIRKDPELCTTPIILVTARAGTESSASSLEAGADDYITKPFNPLDLRARVRASCSRLTPSSIPSKHRRSAWTLPSCWENRGTRTG